MGRTPHKLFIDDSGDKDYTKDNRYGPVGVGPTTYFVFGGLIVPVLEANGIDQTMRTLKQQTFGTADVEIKANWLRRYQERVERYLEPVSKPPKVSSVDERAGEDEEGHMHDRVSFPADA